jgi:hypothetical protein
LLNRVPDEDEMDDELEEEMDDYDDDQGSYGDMDGKERFRCLCSSFTDCFFVRR